MRELHRRFPGNKQQCVKAYAAAEQNGEVERRSNRFDLSPEAYATALFNDAVRKRWL
jgi:hypothetical protein